MQPTISNLLHLFVLVAVAAITLLFSVLPAIIDSSRTSPDIVFAQSNSTPSATQEEADDAVDVGTHTATITPTPTNTPTSTATLQPALVEPLEINIQQDLSFPPNRFGGFLSRMINQLNLDAIFNPAITPTPATPSPSPTPTAVNSTAAFSIYVNQTHAPYVNIFHPPLNYGQGSMQIDVVMDAACNSLLQQTPSPASQTEPQESTKETVSPEIPQQMTIQCYSVVVPMGTLPPGAHDTKLLVDVADQTPQPVNVHVKVRMHQIWMFIIVALGVVSTELLVRWNRRWKYSLAWLARRGKWLDLLSERLDWIFGKRYAHDPGSTSALLQQTKLEVGSSINLLREWLSKACDGDVKLANLPQDRSQDRELLLPLRHAINLYLGNAKKFLGDNLSMTVIETYLNEIRQLVKAQSGDELKRAFDQANTLYTDFGSLFLLNETVSRDYQLLNGMYGEGQFTHDGIKEAWKQLEAIRKAGMQLKESFSSLQRQEETEFSQITKLSSKLAENIASFTSDVLDPASGQLEKVEQINEESAAIAKAKFLSLFLSLTNLSVHREVVEVTTKKANEPLHFPRPITQEKINDIEKYLNSVHDRLNQVTIAEISADATVNMILKPTREHLGAAEDKISNVQDDDTLEQIWRELTNNYQKDRRFSKLGRRLRSLGAREAVDASYLLNAYKYMVDGKALEAEVEIEKAERYRGESLDTLKRRNAAGLSWFKQVRRSLKRSITKRTKDAKLLATSIANSIKNPGNRNESMKPVLHMFARNFITTPQGTADQNLQAQDVQAENANSQSPAELLKQLLSSPDFWLWCGIVLFFSVIGFLLPTESTFIRVTRAVLFAILAMLFYTPLKKIWLWIVDLLKRFWMWITGLPRNWWILISFGIAAGIYLVDRQWGFIAMSIAGILVILFTPLGQNIALAILEFGENLWPILLNIVTTILSQSLIIVVATALAIAANRIVQSADTWGQPFDFLAAFVWGVVANRVAEPAVSGWKNLVDQLVKPKPAANVVVEGESDAKPTP